MPIRMEKDEPRRQPKQEPRIPKNPRQPTQPGGGFGALSQFLPYILMFLFRKPKILVPILVIGALLYFMGFFGGGAVSPIPEDGYDDFQFGCEMKQEVYDKVLVYEPLAAGEKNYIPSSMSLAKYAPPRQHQGRQGSCVGWAGAYGARSILQARATGQPVNESTFSPSFLYNQIALDGCQGSYLRDAMRSMQRDGSLPYEAYPYNPNSCAAQPDQFQRQQASNYRISGYNRLSMDHNRYKVNSAAVRQNLAQGAPVVIGMQVGGTFLNRMRGREVWQPTQQDYNMYGYAGHAMCVVGYDDNKAGGAFQIMNSWGKEWGQNGIAWVRYRDFDHFVKEAYGLHPMGSIEDQTIDPKKLSAAFGLVENQGQQYIPLKKVKANIFRTYQPLKKGDKFKIEVANSIDCYTYVFGEETNGSSYVLFPYTAKHSAYCGIVGTRLFPRDYSLTLDDLGNRDQMAIVVSKKELDFESLNEQINNSKGNSYAEKVNAALSDVLIRNVLLKVGSKTIGFDSEASEGREAVAMIIEVDKF